VGHYMDALWDCASIEQRTLPVAVGRATIARTSRMRILAQVSRCVDTETLDVKHRRKRRVFAQLSKVQGETPALLGRQWKFGT